MVLIRAMICVALTAGGLACRPVGTSGLEQAPVCVARNAEGQEVRCPAPEQAYDGTPCSCVDHETRAAFVGRVRGGL